MNKCGEEIAPYAQCDSPENCGTSPTGCGCDCPACGSCVQAKNPVFNQTCSANVLLILDASFSIVFYNAVNDVIVGARSFWDSFAQVNQIGGTANLAVMQFADTAEIVYAGQSDLNEMLRLDDAWLNSLNAYIDDNVVKPSGYSSYYPTIGCTDWGLALQKAYETPWCARDATTGTCVQTKPDIVVWFTDGAPTEHIGVCDKQCNANRTRADLSGPIGPNNGGDVGVSCYWADKIREQGTKIFLVGVGQAANFVSNVQLVTGPQEWKLQTPDLFPSSDYVIDPDYANLGAIFYNVARGICRCLQDQLPCMDYVPPAGSTVVFPTCDQETSFDARVVVTTGALSHQYPANSVTYGFMYYNFGALFPVYAVEVQPPGSNFNTTGDIIKSDLYDACNVVRKVQCVNGCFSVSDKSFMPRFFISENDVQEAPLSGLTSTCGIPYKKAYAPQPESIEYIWMRGNPAQICAGRALDGTLYEFYQDSAGTVPGVNYRVPVHISTGTGEFYDFNQFTNCSAHGLCSGPVDVLFVVDWQFTDADYALVKSYVIALANSYNNSGLNRIGAYFSDPNAAIAFQTDLNQFITAFIIQPRENIPTDFYTTVSTAISTYWPTPFVQGLTRPRYLLALVGGPDAHGTWSDAEVQTFNNLKIRTGLESWAIGVAAGAAQITLVKTLADRPPRASYDHAYFFGSASILAVSEPDQAVRMCPTESLCSSDCQGLCVCGNCICPQCVTPEPSNLCLTACCDASSQLCTVADKTRLKAPLGCVPDAPDACVSYSCQPSTGTCFTDETCKGRCGCSKVSPCQVNLVNVSNCAASCAAVDVGCECGNLCGAVCDATTGTCSGAKSCDDGNSCTVDSCVVKQVGGEPTPVCVYTDLSNKYCPRVNDCSFSSCNGNSSTPICIVQNITALTDFCGNCIGSPIVCAFPVTSVSTGAIIALALAPTLGIAAIAASIAALLAFRKRSAPGAQSALTSAALQDNPAFVEPGVQGEMPGL